jgi:hypothetical protein
MSSTNEADQPTGQERVARRFQEAHTQFQKEMQDAVCPEDAQRRLLDAYLQYVKALQEAGYDQLKVLEAQLQYVREVQDATASEKALETGRETVSRFVRSFEEAWATLDTANPNPHTLAAMGQWLMTAAAYSRYFPSSEPRDQQRYDSRSEGSVEL